MIAPKNTVSTVAIIEAGHLSIELPADRFKLIDLVGLTTNNLPYYDGKHNDQFFCQELPDFIVASTIQPFSNQYDTESFTVPNATIEIARTAKLRQTFWPHVALLALDPRFTLNYELESVVSQEGFPGSLPIFRRKAGASVGCTLGQEAFDAIQTVTASSVYQGTGLHGAFDRLFGTEWNSGNVAPQWLEVTFKKTLPLRTMLLAVSQNPSGPSEQHISFFDEKDNPIQQISFSKNLATDDTILLHLNDIAVKKIKFDTTISSSWVAWKEIWFSLADEPQNQLQTPKF